MTNLAVMASHEGTSLQTVIDYLALKASRCRLVLVISNNKRSRAIARAEKANIQTRHISSFTHGSRSLADQAIAETLIDESIDWLLLLGYMKPVTAPILEALPERVINIHPSLLPKFGGKGFYGRFVHQAVLDSGETVTGATLHLVSEIYDRGQVISQKEVPVKRQDEIEVLETRVKKAERALLREFLDTLN
ncbi:MAG: phosphoribosylglycinamide formyltransferase [Gammaproteobacteria bacterium]|nr:phosphoribosylglycinamide formyltransferase [Gammaproteobacteria bacterium]|tara:strand:- start:2681 stop:3256 length:576 start_codon:yes stop_codon:yes gene_type:complete